MIAFCGFGITKLLCSSWILLDIITPKWQVDEKLWKSEKVPLLFLKYYSLKYKVNINLGMADAFLPPEIINFSWLCQVA